MTRKLSNVIDLEALLQFVLLGWLLGISLPLPPAPAAETPKGDKFGEFRSGFKTYKADFNLKVGCFDLVHALLIKVGQCYTNLNRFQSNWIVDN